MIIFDQQYMPIMIFIMLCFAGLMVMFYFLLRSMDEMNRNLRNERNELTQMLHGMEKRLAQLLVRHQGDTRTAGAVFDESRDAGIVSDEADVTLAPLPSASSIHTLPVGGLSISPVAPVSLTSEDLPVTPVAPVSDGMVDETANRDGFAVQQEKTIHAQVDASYPDGVMVPEPEDMQGALLASNAEGLMRFDEDIAAYTEAAEFDDAVEDVDGECEGDAFFAPEVFGESESEDESGMAESHGMLADNGLFIQESNEEERDVYGDNQDALSGAYPAGPELPEAVSSDEGDLAGDDLTPHAADAIAYTDIDTTFVEALPEIEMPISSLTGVTGGIIIHEPATAGVSTEYDGSDGALEPHGAMELIELMEPVVSVETADGAVAGEPDDQNFSGDNEESDRVAFVEEAPSSIGMAEIGSDDLYLETHDSTVSESASSVSSAASLDLPDLHLSGEKKAVEKQGLFLFTPEDAAIQNADDAPDFTMDGGELPSLIPQADSGGLSIVNESSLPFWQDEDDEENVIQLTSDEIVYDADESPEASDQQFPGSESGEIFSDFIMSNEPAHEPAKNMSVTSSAAEDEYVFSSDEEEGALPDDAELAEYNEYAGGTGEPAGSATTLYDTSLSDAGDTVEASPSSAEGLDDVIDMDSALAKALLEFGIRDDDVADGQRYLSDTARNSSVSGNIATVLHKDVAGSVGFLEGDVDDQVTLENTGAVGAVESGEPAGYSDLDDGAEDDSASFEFLWEDDTVSTENGPSGLSEDDSADEFAFTDESDAGPLDSVSLAKHELAETGDGERFEDDGQTILPGFFEGEEPVELSTSFIENPAAVSAADSAKVKSVSAKEQDNIVEYIVPE